MSNWKRLTYAALFTILCHEAAAQRVDILAYLVIIREDVRDPLDKLAWSLTLEYAACSAIFRLAYVQGNDPESRPTFARGRKCQSEMLVSGNAHVENIKSTLPKAGAQAALKEMTLYWRLELSEVSGKHHADYGFVVLRNLKAHVERIRLESDW